MKKFRIWTYFYKNPDQYWLGFVITREKFGRSETIKGKFYNVYINALLFRIELIKYVFDFNIGFKKYELNEGEI